MRNLVGKATKPSKFCQSRDLLPYKYEYILPLLLAFVACLSVNSKTSNLLVSAFSSHSQSFRSHLGEKDVHLRRIFIYKTRQSSLNFFRRDEFSEDTIKEGKDNSWIVFQESPSNGSNSQRALAKDSKQNNKSDIDLMERQVIASANAKLDAKRVQDALLSTDDESTYKREQEEPPSALSVATAAGIVTFSAIYSILPAHSLWLSSIGFVAVFTMAMIRYEDADDDNLVGPMARIVGRATLSTIKKSQPKVKAVARAVAAKEDEFERLVKENAELKEWKRRRMAVDDAYGNYTMQELKDLARKNKVQGFSIMNKSTLMMALIEAGALNL